MLYIFVHIVNIRLKSRDKPFEQSRMYTLACMHAHTHENARTHTHTHAYTHATHGVCVCVCVCVCACTRTTHTPTHTHTYARTRTHANTHTLTCTLGDIFITFLTVALCTCRQPSRSAPHHQRQLHAGCSPLLPQRQRLCQRQRQHAQWQC